MKHTSYKNIKRKNEILTFITAEEIGLEFAPIDV